jgi:uncharacterized protein (TIGR01370 family)
MAQYFLIPLAMVLALILPVNGAIASEKEHKNWVVYYGDAIPPEKFLPYDLVVFDSRSHPTLRPLQNRGKILLGYLSIGEAEDYRYDFDKIKAMGVLLEENKHWPGHFVVDIRNPKWTKYLIEEKIPEILFHRFDGLMLDTLESATAMEAQYPGMHKAALNLLQAIRTHYPEAKIMLNRGFDVFPEAAEHIDYLMAESILADSHTDPKKPKLFDESIYQELTGTIRAGQEINPELKVYALDYWVPEDKDGIKALYAKHRENGFVPYVSTIDLQDLLPEPK